MGRFVSQIESGVVYLGIRDVKSGYGSGAFRFYGSSGTFTVPVGVTEVRVTALGAGGGSSQAYWGNCCIGVTGAPGGGGGYVVATVPVTPGCVCTVTVGAAGSSNNPCCVSGDCTSLFTSSGGTGGTSQFGVAVCATGGTGGSSCIRQCNNTAASTAGIGGCVVISAGTQIVCYRGNAGCAGCVTRQTDRNAPLAPGGASGSPIGGNGTGPWPGTSGADVFSCRGFNGQSLDEACLASKFNNTIRWSGEAIFSTLRPSANTCGVINAVAANNPPNCYCVGVYGGAGPYNYPYCCNGASIACSGTSNAGCGGGAAGNEVWCFFCYARNGYSPYVCCGTLYSGGAGNGFVVVEY